MPNACQQLRLTASSTPNASTCWLAKAIKALNDIIIEERVSYDEYNALKAWLIKVGEDGEWPLFLDVWLEHSVEEVATDHREGNKGSIEGPYYVEDSPEVPWNGTIVMREDEPGTPLKFTGQVRSTDGTPLQDARVELWHADSDGFYSQFAPASQSGTYAVPGWSTQTANLNTYHSLCPTRSQPMAPVASSSQQPVGTPGVQRTCTQSSCTRSRVAHRAAVLPGDEHNDDDIASAVKPELMLTHSQQKTVRAKPSTTTSGWTQKPTRFTATKSASEGAKP